MIPSNTLSIIVKKPLSILLWTLLVVLAYFFLDKPIALFCNSLTLGHFEPMLQIISLAGKWTLYAVVFFFAVIYFRYFNKNRQWEIRAWYLFSIVVLPNLLNMALKIILGRARPELLFADQIYGFYFLQLQYEYWSFPSGHAITTAALAVGLGRLFPRYRIFYWLVVLLVVASRILLCRHYLGDVLTGAYLGVFIASLIKSPVSRSALS